MHNTISFGSESLVPIDSGVAMPICVFNNLIHFLSVVLHFELTDNVQSSFFDLALY